MPENEPPAEVRQFLGLRNTDRNVRQPLGAMVLAQNVDIDDTLGLERRDGYTLVTGGLDQVTAAYATRDEKDLYVVDGGILKRVLSVDPLSTQAIATGIGSGPVDWADNDGYVFCAGALNGVIKADTFTAYADWGDDIDQSREVQGQTIETDEADVGTLPPPNDTDTVAFLDGCVWLSYYDPTSDTSFIFKSKPFFWSRYDLATDYTAIPGRILLLEGMGAGSMLIGTDQTIYAVAEGRLQMVADYGVIDGQPDEDTGKVYFWTERGLCRAFPFENLTEETVSVPPGSRAVLAVARRNGNRQAIVITTGGGVPDNAYG